MNKQVNVDNDKRIEGENKKIDSPTCSFDEEQNENEHVVIENNVGFMEPSPSIPINFSNIIYNFFNKASFKSLS